MPGQRPLIGLTCRYQSDAQNPARDLIGHYVPYHRALLAAGALPVLLPVVEDRATLSQYLDRLNGLVFTGGLDVPPESYGQPKHPQTQECHPSRWANDRLLAELVLERPMPVLAICMGVQLLNVVYGGTLIQHLETKVQHAPQAPGNDSLHSIVLEKDSLLYQILGRTELEVNSAHHQAVAKLAPGLRVVARAADGTVEAVEMTDKAFFLGVQWHPERIFERAEQRRLFEIFVSACRRRS
jgi:putative glutamine amidotransferase